MQTFSKVNFFSMTLSEKITKARNEAGKNVKFTPIAAIHTKFKDEDGGVIVGLFSKKSWPSVRQSGMWKLAPETKVKPPVSVPKVNEEKVETIAPTEENEVDPIDAEIKLLKTIEDSRTIALRYNKSNKNKNGFSMTELFAHVGGMGTPTHKEMADFVFDKIK